MFLVETTQRHRALPLQQLHFELVFFRISVLPFVKASPENLCQLRVRFYRPALSTSCLCLSFRMCPHHSPHCNHQIIRSSGATVGVLPGLDISSSVTAFGRTMIDHTKQMVEANFQVALFMFLTFDHRDELEGEVLHSKRLCA